MTGKPASQLAKFWAFGPPEPGKQPAPMNTKGRTTLAERKIDASATEEPTPVEEPTEAPSDASEGLDDLTESDYAVAAETLAQEATQAQEPATQPEGDDEPDGTPREARYRQRARDAEVERDKLRDLVEGMQRAEIQRLVADRLADPADLWRDGATLADLLDGAGRLDPTKLDGTVDRVLAAHPHWRKPLAPYRGPLDSGATNSRSVDMQPKGFKSAFTPRAAD